MNTLKALRLERDRDLTADIVPEAYFRCVAVRELNYPWMAHTFERQLTEIRAAWSDKFLYLHLWAKDSWVVAKETKDKGRVTDDDCLMVEVFGDRGSLWGWQFNALGTLSEYRIEQSHEEVLEETLFDRKWRSQAQHRVKRHDAGWVVEIRIPWLKDLGCSPHRGDELAASFHRIDVDRQGRRSLSTFSGLGAESVVSFHQPAHFGLIVLG